MCPVRRSSAAACTGATASGLALTTEHSDSTGFLRTSLRTSTRSHRRQPDPGHAQPTNSGVYIAVDHGLDTALDTKSLDTSDLDTSETECARRPSSGASRLLLSILRSLGGSQDRRPYHPHPRSHHAATRTARGHHCRCRAGPGGCPAITTKTIAFCA